MEGLSDDVLKIYMLGSFLDRYYNSDRQIEVPCYICRTKKEKPLVIPEREANNVLRLFLSQNFPSLQGEASEGDTAASSRTVQAFEKVYNIGDRWICAECVLDQIMKPSRPRRSRPHPLRGSEPGEESQAATSGPTPPDLQASSVFQKIDKVVLMRGERSPEAIESAIGHLRYFFRVRFGQDQGVCQSCATVFGEIESTTVYHVGEEGICIDCILDRIDQLDRLLNPM